MGSVGRFPGRAPRAVFHVERMEVGMNGATLWCAQYVGPIVERAEREVTHVAGGACMHAAERRLHFQGASIYQVADRYLDKWVWRVGWGDYSLSNIGNWCQAGSVPNLVPGEHFGFDSYDDAFEALGKAPDPPFR